MDSVPQKSASNVLRNLMHYFQQEQKYIFIEEFDALRSDCTNDNHFFLKR